MVGDAELGWAQHAGMSLLWSEFMWKTKTQAWLAVVFIGLGLLSVLAYEAIGSTVAEDGILQEPFALIPLGWLCFFLGGALAVSAIASRVWRGRHDK